MPKYDVAVIGAGLGGLAATALLTKKNKKALVVEPSNAIGGAMGAFEKDGFAFTTNPALSFGFERGGALQDLYETLGISHNASVLSPCYQVALPDRRITVYAEVGETQAELRREFPGEIDAIVAFYRDLRKEALRSRKYRLAAYLSRYRKAGNFIRKYGFSPDLTAFLNIQSLVFFQQPVEDISLASLVLLFDTAPLAMQGGFKRLLDQLLDVVLKNGGEIRYSMPFPELALRNGRAVGIKTPQELAEADTILLNTEQQRQDRTLFMAIRDEVVPVGMYQEVLCLPDYTQPNKFFTLSLNQRDDASTSPKGMRALTVSFTLEPHVMLTSNELLWEVEKMMPFLKDFLIFFEEYTPASRSYTVPAGVTFSSIRTSDGKPVLSRSSQKNIFLLADGWGTPLQTICAAQKLVERLT